MCREMWWNQDSWRLHVSVTVNFPTGRISFRSDGSSCGSFFLRQFCFQYARVCSGDGIPGGADRREGREWGLLGGGCNNRCSCLHVGAQSGESGKAGEYWSENNYDNYTRSWRQMKQTKKRRSDLTSPPHRQLGPSMNPCKFSRWLFGYVPYISIHVRCSFPVFSFQKINPS